MRRRPPPSTAKMDGSDEPSLNSDRFLLGGTITRKNRVFNNNGIVKLVLLVVVFCCPLLSSVGGTSTRGWRSRRGGSGTSSNGRLPPWRKEHPTTIAPAVWWPIPHPKEQSTGGGRRGCGAKMKAFEGPAASVSRIGRGGQDSGNLEKTVGVIVHIFASFLRAVLPPLVAGTRIISGFYRALPTDAITAQAGLVYCFAGGYYPTLFASLSAAQQCGWDTAVGAIGDLTDEATRAVDAFGDTTSSRSSGIATPSARDVFTQKTMAVLATVDPMKINQAAGALYSTWLGVSTVLEREFARTIALSMTVSGYLEPVARFVVSKPFQIVIPDEYHQWIPVLIGWGVKAAAMSVAWRIQRVLTACTSAVTGGLMFARASARMLSKRGVRLFGIVREDHERMVLDEVIGFLIGGIGLYSQLAVQWRRGFDFQVPFPFSLVTWPFDWAERWIEWQITKNTRDSSEMVLEDFR